MKLGQPQVASSSPKAYLRTDSERARVGFSFDFFTLCSIFYAYNRGLACVMTRASNSCQAVMFWDNYLWRTLGQGKGNKIYSLRARYSDTGKQG